ncbi:MULTISPECIES: hypothetical protein [unclassified Aliiroseovarius]|nr:MULTISPECIES: hypothetical protein [unclassified Aliiroseovarius]
MAPTEEIKKEKPVATPINISGSAVAEVRSALMKEMKDPSSVKFGQYKSLKLMDKETQLSTIVVCGKYNAKNSYGGYVGEKMFFAKKMDNGKWSVIADSLGLFACGDAGFKVTFGGDFVSS